MKISMLMDPLHLVRKMTNFHLAAKKLLMRKKIQQNIIMKSAKKKNIWKVKMRLKKMKMKMNRNSL